MFSPNPRGGIEECARQLGWIFRRHQVAYDRDRVRSSAINLRSAF
jgi:hypothetical protein